MNPRLISVAQRLRTGRFRTHPQSLSGGHLPFFDVPLSAHLPLQQKSSASQHTPLQQGPEQHLPLQQFLPGLQHLPLQQVCPDGQQFPLQQVDPAGQHLPLQQI